MNLCLRHRSDLKHLWRASKNDRVSRHRIPCLIENQSIYLLHCPNPAELFGTVHPLEAPGDAASLIYGVAQMSQSCCLQKES